MNNTTPGVKPPAEEARAEAKALASDIEKMLVQFRAKTGLHVNRIEIHTGKFRNGSIAAQAVTLEVML